MNRLIGTIRRECLGRTLFWTAADLEMKLLTRAYLHAVIDNFFRRILAWRVADTFAPVNSAAVLLEASQGATPSETTPVVVADAGIENVNALNGDNSRAQVQNVRVDSSDGNRESVPQQ